MSEFTKPLIFTTPPEKSKRVKDAQTLLHGANAFKQNFHPGDIDEVYGEQSAGATHRSKWFLGYPKRHVNSAFGEVLYDYLRGAKKLPALYAWRRKVRLAAAAKVNTAKIKAVNLALIDAQAGVHEDPADSNEQKYGVWFGANGVYWCAEAVSYWQAHAGNKNFYPGFSASCVEIENAARNGAHHLAITTKPEKGDIVIYNHDEHTELFDRWEEEGVSFRAVGGNTSAHDGSYNNGGEVAVNIRYVHGNFPVTAFIRVGS